METFLNSLITVDEHESFQMRRSFLRQPERHLAPCGNVLLQKKVFAGPGKRSITIADGFAFIQHTLHGHSVSWTIRVINSRCSLFDHTHGPLCQVAYVDKLNKAIRAA